jgi:hypothetical protein
MHPISRNILDDLNTININHREFTHNNLDHINNI